MPFSPTRSIWPARFELGLIVGAVVAIGYLWLGAVLIAIGLIFRSKPQWSALGAWAAVPVIVVSLGFGYVSYRSVNADTTANSSVNGTLSISLSTPGQDVPLTANGAATCATTPSGVITVHAGTNAEPQIVTDDARVVSAQVTLSPDAPDASLSMTIAGLDLSNMTTVTATGSGYAGGQLQITALPLTGTLPGRVTTSRLRRQCGHGRINDALTFDDDGSVIPTRDAA